MSEMFHYSAELVEPGRCGECGASSMWCGKTVYSMNISNQFNSIFKALFGKDGVYELSYMSTSIAIGRLEEAIATLSRARDLVTTGKGVMRLGTVRLFLEHMLLVSSDIRYAACMWRVL